VKLLGVSDEEGTARFIETEVGASIAVGYVVHAADGVDIGVVAADLVAALVVADASFDIDVALQPAVLLSAVGEVEATLGVGATVCLAITSADLVVLDVIARVGIATSRSRGWSRGWSRSWGRCRSRIGWASWAGRRECDGDSRGRSWGYGDVGIHRR